MVGEGGEAEVAEGGEDLGGEGVEGLADFEFPPEFFDGVAADQDDGADGDSQVVWRVGRAAPAG